MNAFCPDCRRELPAIAGAPPSRLEEVAAELAAGRKINAIKIVRELTLWGLKEAKDYVECPHPLAGPLRGEVRQTVPDAMSGLRLCPECRRELPPLAGVPASRLHDVAAALERGNKIEAIKLVREISGLGLKEAKDYVECPHRPQEPNPTRRVMPLGCILVLIALALGVGAAIYILLLPH